MIDVQILNFANKIRNYIFYPTDNNYNELEQTINIYYESTEYDLDDISNCIHTINHFIKRCIENKISYNKLSELRIYAHKMLKRKFRAGYEYINEENISRSIIKSKLKYPEEDAKNYKNVELCELQYGIYRRIIWNPSIKILEEAENLISI